MKEEGNLAVAVSQRHKYSRRLYLQKHSLVGIYEAEFDAATSSNLHLITAVVPARPFNLADQKQM